MIDLTAYLPLAIQNAPLGHPFPAAELRRQCRVTVGGACWPSKQPGFAVVLAIVGGRDGWPYEFYLLDEAEDEDLYQLVRKCDALDAKYAPERWLGDAENKAARKILWELALGRTQGAARDESIRVFRLVSADMLGDQGFYSYAVPVLKTLLHKETRQLFIKDSRIRDYLSLVRAEDLPFLRQGEYPAVEALAYAVHWAQWWVQANEEDKRRPRGFPERPASPWTC